MVFMEKRSTFSGKIGFVLAAAGSAVGLGNLWRFPYLAAKYGGGMFLLVYLVLAITFGFVLMVTEIAIGRRTRQSQMTAYGKLHSGFGILGFLSTLIPFVIVPYYCVIGGWVLKYFWTYLRIVSGDVSSVAALEAAMSPDMDYIKQGYLYFCATEPTSGQLVFAVTQQEHEANVASTTWCRTWIPCARWGRTAWRASPSRSWARRCWARWGRCSIRCPWRWAS